MWPPPAADFRPGGSDMTDGKKKRKRKKKRRSSSQDYTSSTTASTGDHVNSNNGNSSGAAGPTSPPRPNPKPSPEQQRERGVGGLYSPTGATRARRNSEDVVAAAGSAGGSGEVGEGHAGGGKDYDDQDEDDDDQDEGVVIQREGTPTPALANGTENTIKKKKKRTEAAAVVNGDDGVRGGGVDTAAAAGGEAKELAKKENSKKAKEKRQKKSQGAHDLEDVDSSGIPFALPVPGARATASVKPTGRSRSASIESATEFFATKALSGDKANGTIDDGRGATAAKGKAGAISNGSVHEGGGGLGRRKREEANGGVGAATAALSKGRVPRKHQEQRRGLPIFAHKANIIRAVKEHQTVVVVGETGSGKSTQIPQFLYEAGITRGGAGWISGGESGEAATASRGSGKKRGRAPSQEDVFKGSGSSGGDNRGFQGGLIACTQPRRVAAVTVAKRVAAEVGCDLGSTVGYTVRFDDRTSKSTRIKYMTDGVLLREAMSDPLLSAYSAIVLDEAHERSLDTDILFGLVRRLQPKRPDLKVVVMSATLDVDLFRRFFRDSVSLHVPGRTHPVDVMYATEDQVT
ncbi:unnamed protein product [Ectocarpus fasciculatus]